jgi:hypothetical protein
VLFTVKSDWICCCKTIWHNHQYTSHTNCERLFSLMLYICWIINVKISNLVHIFSGMWARMDQWVRLLDYLTTHASLSPIRRGFAPSFVNYKKGRTRLADASDKAYQLLAHSRWFSPGTPASSTTNTGRHNIAEILLKVALNTKNQIKSSWACSNTNTDQQLNRSTIMFVTLNITEPNIESK